MCSKLAFLEHRFCFLFPRLARMLFRAEILQAYKTFVGEGEGRKRRRGALSPLLPMALESHRGPSSSPRSSPTSPSPSPIYLQRSTLPQPVVPSTWTWCFMLHIIIQWCVAILWCLSRFLLSYRWLMNCYDLFELHVLLLVLSYGGLRVMQAWGIPAVGFAICSWFAYGGWREWQKHKPE